MVNGENEFFNLKRNVENVPSGRGKEKSRFYIDLLEKFLDSGDQNWQLEWKAKKPSVVTVRSSLQKLTRKNGGFYFGKIRVSVVGNNVYLINLDKHQTKKQ